MSKNRKNVSSMLRINVSERNTCEISSLCAISEKFGLAPNWNGNRFLNTLITHKSGITHLYQVRIGSGKCPSLPSHQNYGNFIFPTGWKVTYLKTIILSLLAAIARN